MHACRKDTERQWRDVVGVLEVQADALDLPYLDRWADELHLTDLLESARREAEGRGRG